MFNGQNSCVGLSGRLRAVEGRLSEFELERQRGGAALTPRQTLGVWTIFGTGTGFILAAVGAIGALGYFQSKDNVADLVRLEVSASVEKAGTEYWQTRLQGEVRESVRSELRGSIVAFKDACPAEWSATPETEQRILVGGGDVSPSVERVPEGRAYANNRLVIVSELPSFVTVKEVREHQGADVRHLELLSAQFCTPDTQAI